MSIREVLELNRASLLALADKYGARNVRLFGSGARGEDHPESDIDLLVEMEEDRSLLDQIALRQEMESLLGRRVDLVTDKSIYWLLRRRILKEAIPL
ncbi:MAG: nucleotidyltransferase family protein [Blastocatellia bacterium]|nr:nucleotidyltransferase family protein [Blastocatellia bacterium]